MANVNLKELYDTKNFADLTIVAEGRKFAAHKFVVYTIPGLKDLVGTDGDTLTLAEPAAIVERLLQWLYKSPWSGMRIEPERPGGFDELLALYSMAEKYQMPKLRADMVDVVKRQVKPRLITTQQRTTAVMNLCDNSARGTFQRILLEGVQELLEVQVPDPWTAVVTVQAPATQSNPSQPKKRLSSDATTPQDTDEIKIEKRVKKESTEGVKDKPKAQPKKRRSSTKPPPVHCICKTADNDPLLVQCDGCDKWYHPACIGKSGYDAKTIQQHKMWAMEIDVQKLMGVDTAFTCLGCDEKTKRIGDQQLGCS